MSLHYLVKHEWPKTNEIYHCVKKPMHYFFLAFQRRRPCVLASTEHCCNSHHLFLLLDPQPALTCVQVLKFRLKPSLNWRRWARSKQTTTISIFLHFVNSIVYPIILAIWRSSKQFFISEENEIYLFMHRFNCFLEHVEFRWFFRSFVFHKVV